MTSPDFGRISELKEYPVLSMQSIRPLAPSTRNAWPSVMLKKLMSLTQTQCGLAWGASCSALKGSAGSCARAASAAAAARQAPATRSRRPDVLMEPSRHRWLSAARGGNPNASYREPDAPSCTTRESRLYQSATLLPSESGLQRAPHLLVTLGRPDARVAKTGGFIIRARNIERQAVIEDHPMAVFRPQLRADILVDRLQIATGRNTLLYSGVEFGDEVACPRKAARHGLRRL